MQPLQSALDQCVAVIDVAAENKKSLLEELAARAAQVFDWVDGTELFDALWAREQEASTGIGGGVAIPHAVIEGLKQPICLVAKLSQPLEYASVDGRPVQIIFLLASPVGVGQPGGSTKHVRMLARLARLCMRPGFIEELLDAESAEGIVSLIQQENARHA